MAVMTTAAHKYGVSRFAFCMSDKTSLELDPYARRALTREARRHGLSISAYLRFLARRLAAGRVKYL